MLKNKNILVVVPARGGSKGVKFKNIRTIFGIPLVAWVGKIVAQLPFVDRAVVSTDHHKIVKIAKKAGLDVPFMRPKSLSGDIISDWQVLRHALLTTEKIDKKKYDIIIMLQPTCPLRKPRHVIETVKKLIKGNYDAVWTVSETDSKQHPLKQLIFKDDKLNYYDKRGVHIIARQQLKPVYHRNGAAYAYTRDCLVKLKSVKGKKTSAVIIAEPMISIDTELDFKLAEVILNKK
jgi:CMP-N-acetylneuraminic acid synthetase